MRPSPGPLRAAHCGAAPILTDEALGRNTKYYRENNN